MKRSIVVLAIGVLFGISAVAMAASLSQELITQAKTYDGASVEYHGELIGSVLNRGSFAWLNVYDGANAIGVWAQKSQLERVRFAGMYGVRGDLLRVVGVFHRSCVEHGGALDIHAVEIGVLTPGGVLAESVSLRKIKLLGVLLGAIICLWIVRMWRKQRNRK